MSVYLKNIYIYLSYMYSDLLLFMKGVTSTIILQHFYNKS